MPSKYSVSNDWKTRRSCNAKTKIIGEIINGRVTLKSVRKLPAPPTRAASSSVASMLRNAGVKSITLIEMPWPIKFAQTMPGTLKILNGPWSRWKKVFQRDVDHADVRIEQSNPGNRGGEGGHHVGDPKEKFQSMAEGNLRPRQDPRDRHTDRKADRYR